MFPLPIQEIIESYLSLEDVSEVFDTSLGKEKKQMNQLKEKGLDVSIHNIEDLIIYGFHYHLLKKSIDLNDEQFQLLVRYVQDKHLFAKLIKNYKVDNFYEIMNICTVAVSDYILENGFDFSPHIAIKRGFLKMVSLPRRV